MEFIGGRKLSKNWHGLFQFLLEPSLSGNANFFCYPSGDIP